MIKDFIDEYERYKLMGWKAIDQVSDDALNQKIVPDTNSVAVLVRHISGNLISRFTDFLESDGEKSWRNRDAEFEDRSYSRDEVHRHWQAGWDVLESQLALLKDSDLSQTVLIRGQAFTVHEALCRSLAHVAYHVGQIILMARILQGDAWKWITIPKGQSEAYNKNPTMEKRPQ